jgi:prolyl-tRNA synthetase
VSCTDGYEGGKEKETRASLTIRANKGEAEDVKAPSAGAKSLCIPHDQARFGEFPEGENQKCVQCGEKAKRWTLFGRSESFFHLGGVELM